MTEDGLIDLNSIFEGIDPTDPKYWKTPVTSEVLPAYADPYRTLSDGRIINIVDPFDPINKGEHPALLAAADNFGLFGNYFMKKENP